MRLDRCFVPLQDMTNSATALMLSACLPKGMPPIGGGVEVFRVQPPALDRPKPLQRSGSGPLAYLHKTQVRRASRVGCM